MPARARARIVAIAVMLGAWLLPPPANALAANPSTEDSAVRAAPVPR